MKVERLKKPFIHKDFLLQTRHAQRLYHKYAKDLPIIDYHVIYHLNKLPKTIRFKNLTEIGFMVPL
jgi:glucuronate isomerase